MPSGGRPFPAPPPQTRDPPAPMTRPGRILRLLAAASLIASACAPAPDPTPSPATASAGPLGSATPAPSEIPFAPSAWPVAGSACERPGYRGLVGRIEALDARTIRFTLCAPDGAFRTRLADPALAILDTAAVRRLATDPASERSLAGTGPFRIDRWDTGGIILSAIDASASRTPTVVLRWAQDPAARTRELQAASVDGIDAPDAASLDAIATQPELAVTARPGLATAYLAFGTGRAFADVRVRRAIGGSIDRAALVAAAFPAGSVVPTNLAPCTIPGACTGDPWYAFNGPAAAAALAAAGFNLAATYPLHVPDQPEPGLPDPAGVAAAVQAQLQQNVGLQVAIDVMPRDAFDAALAAGTLDGLYLGGVASSLADPAAFLAQLLGPGLTTSPATRAPAAAAAISAALAATTTTDREAAVQQANAAVRSSVPLVPLANPGSVVAFRSDVAGVVASPIGIDPLGAFTPGDRRQLVFMQATEPAGAYCGDQDAADAFRLCALVTEGLYGFPPGGLTAEPRLAETCSPAEDGSVWTCRLRTNLTFQDGARLDAGDVLASFVAQWDASQPLRASRPQGSFTAWDRLFGGSLGTAP